MSQANHDHDHDQIIRKIFEADTPGYLICHALASVLNLTPPPPLGNPVMLASTQALAGYAAGQESMVTEIRATVGRVLFGDPPCPDRLNASTPADGQK